MIPKYSIRLTRLVEIFGQLCCTGYSHPGAKFSWVACPLVTAKERQEIEHFWSTLPGDTCFNSALQRYVQQYTDMLDGGSLKLYRQFMGNRPKPTYGDAPEEYYRLTDYNFWGKPDWMMPW